MTRAAKSKKPETQGRVRAVVPATEPLCDNVLTFQSHPLIQVKEDNPGSYPCVLEILLRPSGARISICYYGNDGNDGYTQHVPISPADFEAFVEFGRAHSFTSAPEGKSPDDWTVREDPVVQIGSEKLDSQSYLEIVLRPDGVSFSAIVKNHDGETTQMIMRISPASFQAIIERCRTHRFEV